MIHIIFYPKYFQFQDKETRHSYDGPLSFFLEHLSSQTIPPGDYFKTFDYKNGVLPVKIIDKRTMDTRTIVIELKPNPISIQSDLSELGLPVDTLLELEAELYNRMEPLDLSTDIQSLYQHHTCHYNQYKFFYNRKKRSREEEYELDTREPDFEFPLTTSINVNAGAPGDSRRFKLLSFIQDWKKQKELDQMEPVIINGDKKKVKKSPATPLFPKHKKCIRTLLFDKECPFSHKTIYTSLNIFETGPNEYEGVLRWGTTEGTSINGSTLRFPIGNKVATEYYIAHFRGFYSVTNRIVSDTSNLKSMGRSASVTSSMEGDDQMSMISEQDSLERRTSVKLKVKPLRKQ